VNDDKRLAKAFLGVYFIAMGLLFLWGTGALDHPVWIVVRK
jgi:hypothetical protein